jgi:hypothetical protein
MSEADVLAYQHSWIIVDTTKFQFLGTSPFVLFYTFHLDCGVASPASD